MFYEHPVELVQENMKNIVELKLHPTCISLLYTHMKTKTPQATHEMLSDTHFNLMLAALPQRIAPKSLLH